MALPFGEKAMCKKVGVGWEGGEGSWVELINAFI
jgi:hypothetical protein